MLIYKVHAAALQFELNGKIETIVAYGNGHINDTYLITTEFERYILQRINNNLFKDVDALMHNIALVTKHIKNNFPLRTTLTLIYSKKNETCYFDGENYYRVYQFIENTVARDRAESAKEMFETGRAFGEYANMLDDFDATKLAEIIPFFHHTEKRYQAFLSSLANNSYNRASSAENEIEFCKQHHSICSTLVKLLESGLMPLRVTHNDTKLNNVLLDAKTLERVAVIDLDTIMPGSLCYDFGDAIRFGCNATFEDDKNLDNVVFRIDFFEAFTDGYLSEIKQHITLVEKEHLAFSAILMTFECGMRFLTDYLNGDIYFKTRHSQHNLDRCRTQFKLVVEMEKKLVTMQKIVEKYFQKHCQSADGSHE